MKTRRTLMCGLAMMVLAIIIAGCSKVDDPSNGGNNNGGNGGNGGGGNGGGNYIEDTLYGYVDLGLPSGTLWATCNVGAEKPEDYGDYFAWGETVTKTVYNWGTYKYGHKVDDWYYLTKYCSISGEGYDGFTDNLTVLEAGDDAATANWGSGWHTPTAEQWQELIDNTTGTWTSLNNVNGSRYTASNGNSIFLPAAGSLIEDGDLQNASDRGYYWSSSLITSNPRSAYGFIIGMSSGYLDINGRIRGYSVRPVHSM